MKSPHNLNLPKKILIANRGEIAIRILRTCRELGIDTVCVHSTADEESLHIKWADESVCIGPPRASQSYLNIPAILSAADITGADAIHPGFGFLSENTDFAKACEKMGVKFIGPTAEVIEKMGDKIISKRIAEAAGVPILKSILVTGKKEDEIIKEVEKIGYPVLIKASAGGGGRGMKRVDQSSDLIPQLSRLSEEAKNAFKDGTLFIEKYIENPRHIEIQIVCDHHGHVIHLGERDCTIQRRFQKIFEESPSPILSQKMREEICASAVKLAKAVGYTNVGTVEFVYDQDESKYYFMEMNTRIQVEHPVTEVRTDLDLVTLQIEIASGMPLSFSQEEVTFHGHVMECRVNAEDPSTGLPGPGKITHYYRPAGIGVRVDDFIYSGYEVGPYYDSMLAKIITHGTNREQCLRRMSRALSETLIEGIPHNLSLLSKIVQNPTFKSGKYSTNFLKENDLK